MTGGLLGRVGSWSEDAGHVGLGPSHLDSGVVPFGRGQNLGFQEHTSV